MRRVFISLLIGLSLLLAACGGGEVETLTAAEAEAEFGPQIAFDPADLPATTRAPVSASDEPEALAFEEKEPTVDLTEDEAAAASSGLPSADEGVCVVVREFIDIISDPARLSEIPDDDTTAAVLRSLDDGAFGTEWNRFAQVMFPQGEPDPAARDQFGPEWILSTDQLAQEQCGYPAMSSLMTALTQTTQRCFTPIAEDGTPGEPVCS